MPPKKKAVAKRKAPTPSAKKPVYKPATNKLGSSKRSKTAASEPSLPTQGGHKLIDEGEIGSRFADPDGQSCGIDGILALAEDLRIEVEDPVLLVIAHQMGAQAQGVFTRAEWLRGFAAIVRGSSTPPRPACPSWRCQLTHPIHLAAQFQGGKGHMLRVSDLQAELPALRATMKDARTLWPVWNWCFDFAKDEPAKKGLCQAEALPLMDMMLEIFPLYASFRKFLVSDEKLAQSRRITKDQWVLTYKFLEQAKVRLLSRCVRHASRSRSRGRSLLSVQPADSSMLSAATSEILASSIRTARGRCWLTIGLNGSKTWGRNRQASLLQLRAVTVRPRST
jgi:hypothetical protein